MIEEKKNIFSSNFYQNLFDNLEINDIDLIVKFLENIIKKNLVYYHQTATGIKFGLNTEFEKDEKPENLKSEEFEAKDIILSVLKLLIDYIREKGENDLIDITKVTEDNQTEKIKENLNHLKSLVIDNSEILNFIINESLLLGSKLEFLDYDINIKLLKLGKTKEKNVKLSFYPMADLSIIYHDSFKEKVKSLKITLSKTKLENLKKDIDDCYDELLSQEKYIKEKLEDK